ncbi:MAG TPA: ABC transporter substrate-binding protein [Thermoanaerobaculia bacterium]
MKRLAWWLAALAALWPVSCARREAPPVASATISRHLLGEPASLDPTVTNEEIGLRVEQMLFRPLVGIDRERSEIPALAKSWTVSHDGTTYEFVLDPDARWEDSTPVTAEDVAFTIDRIRDPKVPAANWKWGFEDLTAVETPDPHRVIVRFQRPYAERLLAFNLPIVSQAAFRRGGDADRQPFASAPYRLESWETGQRLTLVRRDDQPAEKFPYRRIVFHVIPDGAVAFRAGSRGELDEFLVSRDRVPEAQRSPEFGAHNRLMEVPQLLAVSVVWSIRNPVLADARVRRALAHSWPRAEVAKRLYPPDGARLISGPYPAGARENDPSVLPPAYDRAESARLLDEAGITAGKDGPRRQKGKKVSLQTIYLAGPPMYANIVEILRQSYAAVGIELVPRPLDWAALSQRFAAGEFDLFLTANTFLPPNLDPYPFYHSSQTPPAGQNYGFYKNAEADRAMEALRREMDLEKRLEGYHLVHRLLAADPPADFFWTAGQYWAISKRIDGVEVSPMGLFHFLPGPFGWRPAAEAR